MKACIPAVRMRTFFEFAPEYIERIERLRSLFATKPGTSSHMKAVAKTRETFVADLLNFALESFEEEFEEGTYDESLANE